MYQCILLDFVHMAEFLIILVSAFVMSFKSINVMYVFCLGLFPGK